MSTPTFDPASPELWEALARFTSGESSADEARAVAEWLGADPHRRALVDQLDSALQHVGPAPLSDEEVEAALARTRARMAEPDVLPFRVPQRAAKRAWNPAWAIAATLVLALGGAIFVSRVLLQQEPATVATVDAQTFTTGIGETDSLRLPDGSQVVLGPASRLVVTAGYNERDRVVELNGVGMFDVQHDDARPFIVRAGTASITDLGTVFTVWHDANQDVRVAVTTGSVLLAMTATPDEGVILHAGDRGALQSAGPVAARGTVSTADTSWTRGRLAFEDANIRDVAIELRRWYGIELRLVDGADATRHLTAAFNAGESAAHVLEVIALALGATIEMNGDTALLRMPR